MTDFRYTRAHRKNVKILLGIAGASEAGKTWSAMTLGQALAGNLPFAMIDTERNRGKHYADDFNFEHFALAAPFAPEAFLTKVQEVEKRGFPVAVVDSFSHEWSGIGGVRWMAARNNKKPPGNWIVPRTSIRRCWTDCSRRTST